MSTRAKELSEELRSMARLEEGCARLNLDEAANMLEDLDSLLVAEINQKKEKKKAKSARSRLVNWFPVRKD